MPKYTRDRPVEWERIVARRITVERERRNLTYEALAFRMTELGYPLATSALHKLEKGRPPRRISVDELMGFSQVLGIPVEDLLNPAWKFPKLTELIRAAWDAQDAEDRAHDATGAAWKRVAAFVAAHPDQHEHIDAALEAISTEAPDEYERLATRALATGDAVDEARLQAYIQQLLPNVTVDEWFGRSSEKRSDG
ncbi:helix-turn-helix domain-containing protein [Demequina rhizosphaerae]|uniref:helix-turn-helix domain-containing protein n=1 Tax=Demequina rhizosphaerae TaxID=1638985 RepID=UPI000AF237D9|nr:helix-turn-helix transcriptional regulator [Demequina rhizosphaerae]